MLKLEFIMKCYFTVMAAKVVPPVANTIPLYFNRQDRSMCTDYLIKCIWYS